MTEPRQLLDKWLWHARVVRARSDAAALVSGGRVRVNGERKTAPGHGLKRGDVVTVRLDGSVRVLEVVDFAERRGDATAAAATFAEVKADPQQPRTLSHD
jgi:ribosome-associated heat shock protein Hsp15